MARLNRLTLEFVARMAIAKLDARQAALVKTQLPQVREGDWVEVNALANKDDLQQTLEKYNKQAPDECRVDVKEIVRLRHPLAHGSFQLRRSATDLYPAVKI